MESDQYASLFCGKVVYANCFKSVLGMIVRTEEDELYSTHKEADSRIFHHINTLPRPSSVVTREADTDILVIAVGCRRSIGAKLKCWIDAGVQANNTLKYISVDKIRYNLGEKLCKALTAYHAI